MERVIESFVKHQNEAEEKYQKWEEERWRKETELLETHRREEREHEMRLFQMLGQMIKPREGYPNTLHNTTLTMNIKHGTHA